MRTVKYQTESATFKFYLDAVQKRLESRISEPIDPAELESFLALFCDNFFIDHFRLHLVGAF